MAPVPVERIVAQVLREAHAGAHLSTALASAFKLAHVVDEAAREEIARTAMEVLAHGRRIAHALEAARAGVHAGVGIELAAWRLFERRTDVAELRATFDRVDWAAVAAADDALSRESDPVRRIALGCSLPDEVAARLVAQYGAEAEPLARSLAERSPLVVRVNTLKATREQVMASLAAAGFAPRPTRLSPVGIELGTRTNVFRLHEYAEGAIEVQDEGSQLVAALVAPTVGGLVVDACAGSGGKTLALGALMKNRGRLVALDVHDKRLDEFRRRARRAGLSNARALLVAPEGAWPDDLAAFVGRADRVLVDVPCSGLGSLRRKPEPRVRLTTADLERLPAQQEAIARRAMTLVAPGGRLIYATCTLLAEENERVVERLLAGSEFESIAVKEVLGSAVAAPITDPSMMRLTLLPHRHGCDGFFAAVLRRRR